jgi:hypothetical protein
MYIARIPVYTTYGLYSAVQRIMYSIYTIRLDWSPPGISWLGTSQLDKVLLLLGSMYSTLDPSSTKYAGLPSHLIGRLVQYRIKSWFRVVVAAAAACLASPPSKSGCVLCVLSVEVAANEGRPEEQTSEPGVADDGFQGGYSR